MKAKRVAWMALAALMVVGLIACQQSKAPAGPPAVPTPVPGASDEAKAPAPQGGDNAGAPSAPAESLEGELTIFSWWTAGGEADGLAELIKVFEQKYPKVKVVNAAVAGGAGTNAKAVLKTRMLGGDPPGTFQVHGGSELIETWVDAGLMAPITNLFALEGWKSAFPEQLVDMVSKDGEIYAVPSNVHRGNMLWYNKAVFDKAGVAAVPTNFDEWIAACEKIKATGVTPLALASRNKWPVLHLFENLLVEAGGTDFYRELFAGKVPWTDARVKTALEHLAALLKYVNKDHAALTWDQASGQVQQGKAAMNVMGDWAKGYYTAQGWKPGEEYDAAPTPGTGGVFFVVTDTFGLPAKAPNPDLTRAFLKVVGSVEGQLNFNPKKGSIPARTDVPRGAFDVIAQRTMDDFAKDTLVPSAAHGSAVKEAFVVEMNDALSVFLSRKNVDKTASALQQAASDTGVVQ